MIRVVRPVVTAVVLIAAWQLLVWGTGVPRSSSDPVRVAAALYERAGIVGYRAISAVVGDAGAAGLGAGAFR